MNQQYTKSPFLSAVLVTTQLISVHAVGVEGLNIASSANESRRLGQQSRRV